MMEHKDTFDVLVKSLEDSERREMLDRIADVAEMDAAVSEPQAEPARKARVRMEAARKTSRLADEGFWVRLWFKVLSLFSSATPEERYMAHLVEELGVRLSQKYGTYILVKRRIYLDALYRDLIFIENARSFFLPYINEYDKHRGDFYILLASLVAPETAELISAALDPFTESYETDAKKDIHASFIKEMDVAFNSFSDDEKSSMYQAASSMEWFSIFASFSLRHAIGQFSDAAGKGQICSIDTISDDLKKLSSILASAVKVPGRLLEALFMFMQRDMIDDKSFNFDKECTTFVKTATNYLAGIASFKNKVPLTDFVRFSCADILWEPNVERRGEDWFKLFKIASKERFEKRFAEWTKLHDKYLLKTRALSFLKCSSLPELEYVPWEDSWLELKFHRETLFLFLKGFFSNVYQRQISRVLKIILAEGDFFRRENLAEFTDAFNVLEHGKQDIADFEERLSPKGDLGEGFSIALTEKKGTVNGKARLEHLMITVETESGTFCSSVLDALKSMTAILGGILGVSSDSHYGTLSNLSSIYGPDGGNLRSDISAARSKIQECASIMAEISK